MLPCGQLAPPAVLPLHLVDLNGDGLDDLVSAPRLNGRIHLQTRLGLVTGNDPLGVAGRRRRTHHAEREGYFVAD